MPRQSRNAMRSQHLAQRALQNSRHNIAALLDAMHVLAYLVLQWRQRAEDIKIRLDELIENNEDEAEMPVLNKAIHTVILLGLIGVVVVDILLLGATAEWLIELGFPNVPWLVDVGRILVPLAVLTLDLSISEQWSSAREEGEQGGSRSRQYIWLTIGFVFACFMPILVISTYMAKVSVNLDPSDALPMMYKAQLLGLVMLSLVGHILVLVGGNLVREAKAFLLFTIFYHNLRRKYRRATGKQNGAAQRTYQTFIRYADAIEHHNNTYDDSRVTAGPFALAVVQTVNQHHGGAILPVPPPTEPPGTPPAGGNNDQQPPPNQQAPGNAAPDVTTMPDQPQTQPPAPETQSDAGGENEYLRTILEGQIREADGEVRV